MTPPKYSSQAYWERRYNDEEEGSGLDWYCDYTTLAPLLHILLPEPSLGSEAAWSVLEIGCGDRPLAPHLAADPHFGGAHVTAIDYASCVVRSLRQRERGRANINSNAGCGDGADYHLGAGASRPVTYERQDARALVYREESFDLVLDKGTLDAMLCSSDEGFGNARKICSEAARVLRTRGCLVIVSHMSPMGEEGGAFISHSLLPALLTQKSRGGAVSSVSAWSIDVHFQEGSEEDGPFVYAVSKHSRPATRAACRGSSIDEIPLRLHEH